MWNLIILQVLFGYFAESQATDFEGAVDEEQSVGDYGYLSDSDLESDEDERIYSSDHAIRLTGHPPDPVEVSGDDKNACERREGRVERGEGR